MKKRKKSIINRLTIFFVCAIILPACAYRTPDEDWVRNGRVRLLLNWQTRALPPTMTYFFYKDGTGSPVIRKGDASGYEGSLPAGRYKVMVCNTGCENVLLETGNGYDGACGRARQVSSLKSSGVSIVQPGNLYGCGCEQVDVGGEETAVKELNPAGLVKKLELNIKIVGGETGKVLPEKITGRLTGVSSGVYLASGKPVSDTPAFMVFEPGAAASGVYTTNLSLFSLPERTEDALPVCLLLEMELSDGTEVSTSTDITVEIGKAFAEFTFSVILDLTIRYDEVGGLTILLAEWKKGNDGSGIIDP